MREHFLCENELGHDLPITWFNSVHPTQPNQFLLHLLFSIRDFDNEVNLLSGLCIKDCFIKAGLLGARLEPQCVNSKICIGATGVFVRWVVQQFDKFVVSAHRALHECLFFDRIILDEMPLVLYM